jgi:hypothetical protein
MVPGSRAAVGRSTGTRGSGHCVVLCALGVLEMGQRRHNLELRKDHAARRRRPMRTATARGMASAGARQPAFMQCNGMPSRRKSGRAATAVAHRTISHPVHTERTSPRSQPEWVPSWPDRHVSRCTLHATCNAASCCMYSTCHLARCLATRNVCSGRRYGSVTSGVLSPFVTWLDTCTCPPPPARPFTARRSQAKPARPAQPAAEAAR